MLRQSPTSLRKHSASSRHTQKATSADDTMAHIDQLGDLSTMLDAVFMRDSPASPGKHLELTRSSHGKYGVA